MRSKHFNNVYKPGPLVVITFEFPVNNRVSEVSFFPLERRGKYQPWTVRVVHSFGVTKYQTTSRPTPLKALWFLKDAIRLERDLKKIV